jgi:hypothetical protein
MQRSRSISRGYGGSSRRIVVTFGAEVECTESEGAEALAFHYCGRQAESPSVNHGSAVQHHLPKLIQNRVSSQMPRPQAHTRSAR